ncbi:MAG: amidase [Burkholderiales bacterium]|nr:amidase [Burkholderiales bacterium]
MKRRDFIRIGLLGAGAMRGGVAMAAGKSGFTVVEAGVVELQAAMQAGTLSARALVKAYLARIRAVDRAGPRLNAIIELNPDALAIAAELDRERKATGPRGPLHGIPILIKDNIATADKMQTTAGSLALLGVKPPRDAFVASRLRAAGAIILGKTNLSEWANFRSTRSTSGWSARGGLTRNPYALDRNTSGSSSGSAAAIAASLAACAVGTETDGSITSPAAINGLVGIKPTVGLISRNGIVPIAHSQDTAGPMARTVADAAALLGALAGSDPRDDATRGAASRMVDYTRHLDADGLRGARIGVVRANFGGRNDLVSAVVDEALKVLQSRGAILIDPVELPNAGKYGQSELDVLLYELKADLAAYFAEFAPGSALRTLQDVIDFNERERAREMPHFGQEYFLRAQAKGGLDSKEYLDALANNHRYARAEGIDQALREHRLDALVAPTTGPAWLTDFIKGDASGGGFTQPAAVAGYPHITVPAGFVHGLPAGISFVGGAWSEPTLIRLAYAYEQASRQRRAPAFARTVNPES